MQPGVVPETTARRVQVTGGTGPGTTRLTAFDAALQDAGIHDANLIRVSSITPASATTERPDPEELAAHIEPGAYFPAVYAWQASDTPGEQVHAAVAGARLDAGYGLNVEHHGTDMGEAAVRERCRSMLEEMAVRRDATIDGDVWIRYESTTVSRESAWEAALAAILYTQ